MDPLDPRHGTDAGAVAHRREYGERPCTACLEGHRRANILRQLYPRKTPSIGTRRRIQALQAIGYSRARIAHALGYSDYGALTYMTRDTTTTILKVTAERVAAVYDELCMTIPDDPGARRARTWAKKHGYAPPLAWDDIDHDPAPGGAFTGTTRQLDGPPRDSIDHARVERLLAGEWALAAEATRSERQAVLARWPGALNDLERLTGWRVDRYHLPNGAA